MTNFLPNVSLFFSFINRISKSFEEYNQPPPHSQLNTTKFQSQMKVNNFYLALQTYQEQAVA